MLDYNKLSSGVFERSKGEYLTHLKEERKANEFMEVIFELRF